MPELPDADPVMESVRRLPAPPLRPFVAWYSGYRQVRLPPGRHRGLPGPYMTVIVTFDDPITIAAHPDPRTPPGRYDAVVGGLHASPALITHQAVRRVSSSPSARSGRGLSSASRLVSSPTSISRERSCSARGRGNCRSGCRALPPGRSASG